MFYPNPCYYKECYKETVLYQHYIFFFSLLVMDKKKDAQLYLVMSTIGHYSLFPLLFTQAGKSLLLHTQLY